jgi:hypothetical protein
VVEIDEDDKNASLFEIKDAFTTSKKNSYVTKVVRKEFKTPLEILSDDLLTIPNLEV